ncbi:MAG: TonB-dependent receptor [Desulfobacterales bacterium]|nr:TonB-dependent receptor [Desulfobacterales bacterium]
MHLVVIAGGLTGVDALLADARQLSAGVFAENDWVLTDAFVLNIGGRIDYIEAESEDLYNWITPPNPAMTPTLKREAEDKEDVSWGAHVGLTWNPAAQWSTTFIAASSYCTPDLFDRFKYIAFAGGATYGNPDLDPERSLFFEGGLHYDSSRLSVSGSLYLNNVDDLIAEQMVSPGLYRMENIDEARIYGGELEATFRFAPLWSAYGNMAYTRGANEKADENLSFIPPFNGLLGVAYNPALGWWGAVEMRWAADQDDVSPGESETPGWAAFDIMLGYRFDVSNTSHDILLTVHNLFDADYRNHLSTSRNIDLNEPGLNAVLAWKMEF